MSSDVLQCPLMSCDVRQFLFNFGLPLIEEKEEITRINACSQLYKKGGMEPPFQGTYATGFPSFLLGNKISLSAASDLGRRPKNPQVF